MTVSLLGKKPDVFSLGRSQKAAEGFVEFDDRFIAVFLKCQKSVHAAIIEFNTLSDTVRA